ncbi:MAG TPA: DUF1376 domain-containing protein [Myxococcales bacterium]|jgi:uncharacterized protein YdaU (DUF1376 family)
MAKSPYLCWFPSDFIAATRHLTLLERGAYRELMDHMWLLADRQGSPSLPDDPNVISQLLGIQRREWEAIRAALVDHPLGGVLTAEDGRLAQRRLTADWEEANQRRQALADGAAKTNAKRAKGGTPSAPPIGTPSDTPTEAPSGTPSGTLSVAPSDTPSVAPSEPPSDTPTDAIGETPGASTRARPIPIPIPTSIPKPQVVSNREVDAICENPFQAHTPAFPASSPPERALERAPSKAPPKGKPDPNSAYSADFERFWDAYPARRGVKAGKHEAWMAWQKAGKTLPPVAVLVEIVAALSRTSTWREDGGKYIPMAATWLNNRRWEDEIARNPNALGSLGDEFAAWMAANPALAAAYRARGGEYARA